MLLQAIEIYGTVYFGSVIHKTINTKHMHDLGAKHISQTIKKQISQYVFNKHWIGKKV